MSRVFGDRSGSPRIIQGDGKKKADDNFSLALLSRDDCIYHSLTKEGPLVNICPVIPQLCLDFLVRSKTYLNEHSPSTNRELILSNNLNLRMW